MWNIQKTRVGCNRFPSVRACTTRRATAITREIAAARALIIARESLTPVATSATFCHPCATHSNNYWWWWDLTFFFFIPSVTTATTNQDILQHQVAWRCLIAVIRVGEGHSHLEPALSSWRHTQVVHRTECYADSISRLFQLLFLWRSLRYPRRGDGTRADPVPQATAAVAFSARPRTAHLVSVSFSARCCYYCYCWWFYRSTLWQHGTTVASRNGTLWASPSPARNSPPRAAKAASGSPRGPERPRLLDFTRRRSGLPKYRTVRSISRDSSRL